MNGVGSRIEVFEYQGNANEEEATLWEGLTAPTEEEKAAEEAPVVSQVVEPSPQVDEKSLVEQELRQDFERRLSEETRRAFEQGRERGRQEGQQAEREAQAAASAAADEHRNQQIAAIAEKFHAERDHFLHQAELEVVKLSLAVAARIMRRESQMDPLLLTGAVRVALGQLAGSTKVRLRVPQSDLEMWRQAIALIPRLAVKPEVLPGEELRTGDCRIETELGSVDLGIRSQLGEIESGFFDRAAGLRSADGQPPDAELVAEEPRP